MTNITVSDIDFDGVGAVQAPAFRAASLFVAERVVKFC